MPSIPALAPSPVEAIHCRRRAFTLVELLVVIGIIAVLMSILIPVAFKIQESARAASSQAIIAQIQGACETYHGDFGAYPGPIPNYAVATGLLNQAGPPLGPADQIYFRANPAATPVLMSDQSQITMAENMVLGLEGGLIRVGNTICYDPTLVGTGPRTLGTNINTAKAYPPYLPATNLFKLGGQFHDDAGRAADSQIPEFIDGFSSPMPILYLRAIKGRATPTDISHWGNQDNSVVTYCVDARLNAGLGNPCCGQYDVSQILAYTGSWHAGMPAVQQNQQMQPQDTTPIGVGKKLKRYYLQVTSPSGTFTPSSDLTVLPFHGLNFVDISAVTTLSQAGSQRAPNNSTGTYFMPMDAFAYFSNPNALGKPRQEDGFILIGAGKDRVYGSEDDQTNFGAVIP